MENVRLAFICTGNICRSPMAEVSARHLLDEDPLTRGRVTVSSAGTARWHVGEQMDPRARSALDRGGFTGPGSPAAFADRDYLNAQDLVVVMTQEHLRDVRSRLTAPHVRVELARDLLGSPRGLEVADPYYGNAADFDACLAQLTEVGRYLRTEFRQRWGGESSSGG